MDRLGRLAVVGRLVLVVEEPSFLELGLPFEQAASKDCPVLAEVQVQRLDTLAVEVLLESVLVLAVLHTAVDHRLIPGSQLAEWPEWWFGSSPC